ncbi:MAG: arsenate reductase ArsC [Rhodospirillales bacterium]|nr:arsenate reductase ArsC [Acetobacter sp.]
MAEGFARCYGSDVMDVESAGMAPATIVQPLTKLVMQEKNINLDGVFPKDLGSVEVPSFDLIINMSGTKLPESLPIEVRDWKVEDPIGRSEEVYIEVRNRIERLVMDLVLELRKEARKGQPRIPARRVLGRTGGARFR